MIDIRTLRQGVGLLTREERREALRVLVVIVITALMSAGMVGSIFPFLSVLADPGRIQTVPALARAYDWGGFESDHAFLVALGLGSIVVIVVANLAKIAQVWVVNRFALMRMHVLSHRLLGAYLAQPYAFFLTSHSGDLGTQILSETQQVVQSFFRPMGEAVAALFTVVSIVTLLLWVEPLIALTAFVVLGAIYSGTFALTRRFVTRWGRLRARTNSERFRIAGEALGGVKDIKLLGREAAYLDRYAAPSRRMAGVMLRVVVLGQVPMNVVQIALFGGVVLLCLALLDPAALARGEALANILPLLGIFAFAGQRLIPEVQKLYQGLTQLSFGASAVARVHADLSLLKSGAALPRDMPQALGLKDSLELRAVSYRYPNAEMPGLADINLTIRAGERIGIVGSTGAGKTTLADIVLGLLSPTEGCLVVDGTEVMAKSLRAWQQSVGYVPQDIFLTDASVAENIALALPFEEIDRNRVEAAARIAQIDSFVREELPDGYETAIGERGVRLSGGQRQRIGIARALYHDADLIVFDEATSALDNLTEAEVMAAIDALPGSKTVLMIAHRLSTVKSCDRILVLDHGRIAGFDTWDALINTNAAFRSFADPSRAA
ncbi:ABC transporter ATP-binding protein [Rhodovulum adriaticum]|uniref:ABC-type bacteriocin/lantibiotic exporter with double-glycine peptidase domain n=1 Tax=Rhodovulum adriaticum TaxID=35804 RepID=A0A4R2NH88_RHOAD|nr:ABC transporter ATP-binding protein [Rhodovulum adriaticum]MBK1636513.1 ABC transporter ATP-binding protein [Rhodovulum adriaticum]TCP20737.1 ABC-type bacteriocin/lantibiotic exporter with double-glycine peptidase domain [Rhodovulum adriaticum]